jgi:hypothetical protein
VLEPGTWISVELEALFRGFTTVLHLETWSLVVLEALFRESHHCAEHLELGVL